MSLSDTVGFIRDLPHKLVEAFRATLQEAAEADLLLHVVDASSPQLDEQRAEVERVLAEIGAEDVPQILVYNKLDRSSSRSAAQRCATGSSAATGALAPRVFVSAADGHGLDRAARLIADVAAGRALDVARQRRHLSGAGRSPRLPDNPIRRPKPSSTA